MKDERYQSLSVCKNPYQKSVEEEKRKKKRKEKKKREKERSRDYIKVSVAVKREGEKRGQDRK